MMNPKWIDGFLEAARQLRYRASIARSRGYDQIAGAMEAEAASFAAQADAEATDPRFTPPPPPIPRRR